MSKHGCKTGTDSIPRRLSALGYKSYREYLASPHWAEKRQRFSDRTPKHCKACGATGCRLSVHHRTYKRLGREKLADLAFLCDDCHGKVHRFGGQNIWANTEFLIKMKGLPSGTVPTVSVTTRGSDEGAPWS